MLFSVSETTSNWHSTAVLSTRGSVLILSMAKNQSDVENLVKNCLTYFFKKLYVKWNRKNQDANSCKQFII